MMTDSVGVPLVVTGFLFGTALLAGKLLINRFSVPTSGDPRTALAKPIPRAFILLALGGFVGLLASILCAFAAHNVVAGGFLTLLYVGTCCYPIKVDAVRDPCCSSIELPIQQPASCEPLDVGCNPTSQGVQ